jgi:cell division transport system permease protein
MAQFGKASSKRGQANYASAIIGVALVLFLFGLLGWFFLNVRKSGDYFKEKIQVQAFLFPDANAKRIDSLTNYIKSIPYARDVRHITKEMAAEIWNKDNDSSWKKMLDYNPLPASIDFFVQANYVQKDSLTALSENLEMAYPGMIKEFKFPTETVQKVSSYVKTVAAIFLIAAILLTILVVFSIDNTIRLAMYSNRFLIKTMQMVGATRGFITRPINIRAIINGFIASIIAIVAIWGTIFLIQNYAAQNSLDLKDLQDTKSLLLLFVLIIILGITISLASTHRSVLKYLKMKLDDLY